MKVRDLIAALRDCPPNAVVGFAYGARDHWRSVLVDRVKSVEDGKIAWSEYHGTNKVVGPADEEWDDAEDCIILEG